MIRQDNMKINFITKCNKILNLNLTDFMVKAFLINNDVYFHKFDYEVTVYFSNCLEPLIYKIQFTQNLFFVTCHFFKLSYEFVTSCSCYLFY